MKAYCEKNSTCRREVLFKDFDENSVHYKVCNVNVVNAQPRHKGSVVNMFLADDSTPGIYMLLLLCTHILSQNMLQIIACDAIFWLASGQ